MIHRIASCSCPRSPLSFKKLPDTFPPTTTVSANVLINICACVKNNSTSALLERNFPDAGKLCLQVVVTVNQQIVMEEGPDGSAA